MARRRYSTEEIVDKLREGEVLIAKGTSVAQAWKLIGVADQTYDKGRRGCSRPGRVTSSGTWRGCNRSQAVSGCRVFGPGPFARSCGRPTRRARLGTMVTRAANAAVKVTLDFVLGTATALSAGGGQTPRKGRDHGVRQGI